MSKWFLPDREIAIKRGWIYQVQWEERGKPCFIRCTSEGTRNRWVKDLTKEKLAHEVIDLKEELKIP